MMEESDRNEQWQKLFVNDYNALIALLHENQPADIADFLSNLEIKQILEIFNDIHDVQLQGKVFAELDPAIQLDLYKFIPKKILLIFSSRCFLNLVCAFIVNYLYRNKPVFFHFLTKIFVKMLSLLALILTTQQEV